jgi:16S rRNA (guanine527-N7)-methyltransferase
LSRRSADPLGDLLGVFPALVGRPAEPGDRQRFQQYLDLFLRWNQTHRMTALDSARGVVHDLFIDSLLFLALLPPRPLTLVDLGAGAGIPGLPLRLADPAIAVTLVVARRKRVSFLLTVKRELDLGNVAVREGRAEVLVEQDPDLAGRFDAVAVRSVGAAERLLPLARKYLKPGGLFIATGPPDPPPQASLEIVRIAVPGTRYARIFLKAVKES